MPSEVSTAGADQHLGRVVDELRRDLEAKSRELAEAREQQTATAGILAAISSSPADLQRAFAEIAARAARLCDANDATIVKVDGKALRIVAHHWSIPAAPAERNVLPLIRGVLVGRAVLERRIIQVEDLQADSDEYPEGSALARKLGHRTVLAVPLMHAGEAIGAIAIRQTEARLFTERQIDLLKTFADQAVIAIENTRLFQEVQARTRELQESLEYQTAISDVLGVIGRSKFDLEPMLTAIAGTACRLCDAHDARIALRHGEWIDYAAGHGSAWIGNERLPVVPQLVAGRAILERKPIHIHDVTIAGEDFALSRELAISRGHRTILAVPLLREEQAIGCLFLRRSEVRPFSDKQVVLLETFADQAVIAIENTRLFEAEQASKRELTEALEQQTATAEVLKVISRSALDLQKVLDALVESAARLCDAYDAAIFQVFGDSLRLVAHHGQIPLGGPVGQYTVPLVRRLVMGRAVIDRRTIQVADILAEGDEYPEGRKNALQVGYRTVLGVPLVHAGKSFWGDLNTARRSASVH